VEATAREEELFVKTVARSLAKQEEDEKKTKTKKESEGKKEKGKKKKKNVKMTKSMGDEESDRIPMYLVVHRVDGKPKHIVFIAGLQTPAQRLAVIQQKLKASAASHSFHERFIGFIRPASDRMSTVVLNRQPWKRREDDTDLVQLAEDVKDYKEFSDATLDAIEDSQIVGRFYVTQDDEPRVVLAENIAKAGDAVEGTKVVSMGRQRFAPDAVDPRGRRHYWLTKFDREDWQYLLSL
jgi:hypothetical protein